MIVVTANLGRGASPAKVRANLRRVHRRFRSAIIGLQEIDEADKPNEHRITRQVLGKRYRYAGWHTFTPIAFTRRWRRKRTRVRKLCNGLAKFTPRRFVVAQALKRKGRPGLPPIVVLNTHWPINRPQTQALRRDCQETLQAEVDYWFGLGYSIVILGDFNGWPDRMHARERRVVSAGLDHIRVIEHPRGCQVKVIRTGKIKMNIDPHNAHWAKLRLSRPAR